MTSLILRTASAFLVWLMLAFSLYLLVRGHNEPGGGFVGGLVAGCAFALVTFSEGAAAVRRRFRVDPRAVAMAGVGVAVAAGAWPLVADEPFLTGLWAFPAGLPLGTPLLFDVGVYLVVVGAVLTVIAALEEEMA